MNYIDETVNIQESLFTSNLDFETTSLRVFMFQYQNNAIYKKWVDALNVSVSDIKSVDEIPFLPIRFFKTHRVVSTAFYTDTVFESSGTTETINSRHYVKDAGIYEKSFFTCFNQVYGAVKVWGVLGVVPSYLERQNSSLVYMVQKLVQESGAPESGFYLYDVDKLATTLATLEAQGKKTLLIGVTFALLDFAEKYPIPLQHTVIMETGGMKGRRKEMIRTEVQDVLKKAFSVETIHSEYGMSELLSQAYSKGNGVFQCPNWMRVLLRDEDDPLSIKEITNHVERGLINVIDLANIYSCSFIATDDLGIIHPNGFFEVTGRMDNSDLRGCSLLAL